MLTGMLNKDISQEPLCKVVERMEKKIESKEELQGQILFFSPLFLRLLKTSFPYVRNALMVH